MVIKKIVIVIENTYNNHNQAWLVLHAKMKQTSQYAAKTK